jgi:vitamin B12 transporter
VNNTKTHSPARAPRASARLFPSFAFAGKATATALAFAALIALATATTAPAARAQTAPAARAQTAPVPAPTSMPAASTPDNDATSTTVQLEAYVVSAARTQQNIKLTPSSVTSLALSGLSRIQIPDLRTALQMTPGVNISETGGGIGSQSTISIRGAGTNQTLFLIDGIRMNSEDFTSDYRNFLGAAGLAGLDRVEILRGPQSTLYGSAAMGGVVSLETARGRGPASGAITLDGGSFNTIGATASVAGSSPVVINLTSAPQTLGYSAALTASRTDNDRDYNTSKQYSGSTRIEYQLADRVTAGFTYRGTRSSYEEPGSTYSPWPGIADLNIDIATLYVDWKPLSIFNTRLIYGWIQNIYDMRNPDGTPSSYAHSTRNVVDWQNTWQALEQLQLIAGINAEWSIYDYASNDLDYSERLASAYINAIANPVKNLELTLGVRGDDYSTFNSHATWRAGVAYRIEKSKTTLRATYGTGFNAPSPQYVSGGGYYVASPGLNPEKSKGWDIGIEQDLWHDRITLGASYFRNDFQDKFGYQYDAFWNTLTYNIPGATTKGLEAFLYTRLIAGLNAQLTYTYLDARENNGARLIRMPRHMLATDVNCQFTKKLLVGAGFNWVADRPDESTFATPPTVSMPGYITVRAYASCNVCKNLKLKLRVENLLDKKYDTVAGYPGLPLGAFGGVEWKF